MKDYFENEYEKDSDPKTYFLFTRQFPSGTLSFRTDARVNRFSSMTERLPEIQYNIISQRLGNTGFYFKNISTYSNLVMKTAAPSEVRQNTMRVDTDSEISYPFRFSFLEFNPYVGGRETYYSKTKDESRYDIMRGLFKTGVDISTKFYKVIDIEGDFFGIDVNRLRHIITPSIAYLFTSEPTVFNSKIDQFDEIDNVTQDHTINFSLENKLQTKREDKSVDLLRAVVGTDFRLKEYAGSEVHGFDHITADIEIKPADWLSFYWDADFDTTKDRLQSSNVDLYLNDDNEKWSFNFGKRYSYDVDDQITTELIYAINPKWKFRTYFRLDTDSGTVKEQEYTITRDLHCWEMDINFNETRGEGSEIWLVFRLKAFPDIGIDFGTSFNKRKLGSQSP